MSIIFFITYSRHHIITYKIIFINIISNNYSKLFINQLSIIELITLFIISNFFSKIASTFFTNNIVYNTLLPIHSKHFYKTSIDISCFYRITIIKYIYQLLSLSLPVASSI